MVGLFACIYVYGGYGRAGHRSTHRHELVGGAEHSVALPAAVRRRRWRFLRLPASASTPHIYMSCQTSTARTHVYAQEKEWSYLYHMYVCPRSTHLSASTEHRTRRLRRGRRRSSAEPERRAAACGERVWGLVVKVEGEAGAIGITQVANRGGSRGCSRYDTIDIQGTGREVEWKRRQRPCLRWF